MKSIKFMHDSDQNSEATIMCTFSCHAVLIQATPKNIILQNIQIVECGPKEGNTHALGTNPTQRGEDHWRNSLVFPSSKASLLRELHLYVKHDMTMDVLQFFLMWPCLHQKCKSNMHILHFFCNCFSPNSIPFCSWILHAFFTFLECECHTCASASYRNSSFQKSFNHVISRLSEPTKIMQILNQFIEIWHTRNLQRA